MEIVFFAVVACLVLVRLYQVLGQNRGAPPPIVKDNYVGPNMNSGLVKPIIDEKPEEAFVPKIESQITALENEYGIMAPKIAELISAEPNFNPKVFEEVSGRAYEAIVTAYSTGDTKTLESLLTPNVFVAYQNIIAERAKNNGKKIDIVRLADPKIKDVEFINGNAQIDISFAATLVEEGQKPINTQEIWTFERKIPSKDPIWKLCAVATA